jgi:cyanophycin synthetase
MATTTDTSADSTPRSHTALLALGRLQAMPGYLPGLRQASIIAEFRVLAAPPARVVQLFLQVAEAALGPLPALEGLPALERHVALDCVTRATLGMLQAAGWPLLSKPVVLPGADASQVRIAFPSVHNSGQSLPLALRSALDLLHAIAADGNAARDAAPLRESVKRLRAPAPRGMNTIRFLEAAHAQEVPWKRVAGNVYQFGWGARARWLDSSFTDQTSRISATLSRDKRHAAKILREAGIPVPAHGSAANEAQALQIAAQLGYPVVVKPADLDGGQGVYTHLDGPADVAKAYAAARQLSKQVIVEKHVFGNDYRLQVFKGKVYWATHRVPASVTGDGASTVRALVAQTNRDPLRNPPHGFKQIALDDEAHAWLARQGLALDAVPAKDRHVRLKGAANVASGGMITPVLESAHPDNVALAARAANVLRLDLAGIDLLIPDICRSWLETGAAICEVNAQPQMSWHLPALLLPQLVKARGRIPVVVVLGGDSTAPACQLLCDGLRTAWPGAGLATAQGAWVAERQVAKGPMTSFAAAQCLLDDPTVTLAVLHVGDTGMFRSGCPVDSIDHLALVGPVRPAEQTSAANWNQTLALAALLGGMSKQVWLLDSAPEWRQHPRRPAAIPAACSDARQVLELILRTVKDEEAP